MKSPTPCRQEPAFTKEPPGDRTVCYCFDVSEGDLRDEVARVGRSDAAARITAHVQAGRCACEIKNPQGSCCLGNLASAAPEAHAPAARPEQGEDDAR